MLRPQLIAVCAVIGLIGAAQSAIFSVGHVNAIGTRGKLRFANVLADDARGWRYSRGHYEVQEPGYYYLTFNGLSRHNDPLTLAVFRNNEEFTAGYGSGNDYSTASNSGLAYLNRGDRISLRIISGFAHESNDPRRNYFTLTGYRVGDAGINLPPPVPAFAGGLSPAPVGPPGALSGLNQQPAGIGIATRFSSPIAASPAPSGDLGVEEADNFRPLDADAAGPV